MGIEYVDVYTFQHLASGMLTHSLLKTIGVPTCTNFILSNGIHAFMEYMEQNVSPSGKRLENKRNHITDILAFLMGWCISMYFNFEIPEQYRVFAWIILGVSMAKEILREMYPYSCIGAFRD